MTENSSHDEANITRLLRTVDEKQEASESRKKRAQYPKGWEPRVTLEEASGEAVSKILDGPTKDEVDLIEGWNLDPNVWEIEDGSLAVNRWQQDDESDNWVYQYKARLRKRRSALNIDISEIYSVIDNFTPSKRYDIYGSDCMVVALADWQIGKGPEGSGGSGVEQTVLAIKQMITDVERRVEELRKIGRRIGTLYVVGMGDLIEQCTGNYSVQTFTVELNRRDQIKATLRLLVDALQRWAPLFDKVVVGAVGGNHGENRMNGKKYTDDADNDDVAVFESLALVLSQNSKYDNVSFVIPNEELYIVLDIAGTHVCFTHGHLSGGSGSFPQQKQWNWWKNQMGGQLPAGDADVLVTAHFHHFSYIDHGPRAHIQCPAMDCGSKWFRDLAGKDSKRGTLTFVVNETGVDDIKIL